MAGRKQAIGYASARAAKLFRDERGVIWKPAAVKLAAQDQNGVIRERRELPRRRRGERPQQNSS
jgi:hypothetical protein